MTMEHRQPVAAPPSTGWERFLLAEAVVFHALCALALAGGAQWSWAVAFAVAAAAAGLLLRHVTAATQIVTWYVIFPLGVAWGVTLAYGVGDSAASTLGVVAWPFLYLPWVVVAVRLALGRA